MKVDAFQYRSPRHITKVDMLKGDIPFEFLGAVVRRGSLNHFGSLVKHFLDAFGARTCTTGEVGQLREIAHGLVPHLDIDKEKDQCADIDGIGINAKETQADSIACRNISSHTDDNGGNEYPKNGD